MHCVAGHHAYSGRHLFRHRIEILEVGTAHGLAHPVGDRIRGNGEADVVQRLIELCRDVCAPSSLPTTANGSDLSVQSMRPSSSVSDRKASIRSSARLHMLDGCPIQIGVP